MEPGIPSKAFTIGLPGVLRPYLRPFLAESKQKQKCGSFSNKLRLTIGLAGGLAAGAMGVPPLHQGILGWAVTRAAFFVFFLCIDVYNHVIVESFALQGNFDRQQHR